MPSFYRQSRKFKVHPLRTGFSDSLKWSSCILRKDMFLYHDYLDLVGVLVFAELGNSLQGFDLATGEGWYNERRSRSENHNVQIEN